MKSNRFANTGFLSLVLATLIFLVALFAFKLSIDEYDAQKQHPTAQHHAENEVARETAVLGVGAEGWTAIFTGGLLVFTMALAVFTYRLFCVTKDGIAEQADLARISLGKAERSAQAAESALTGLNRPYVFPVIFRHTIPANLTFGRLQSADPIIIEYAYRNFGKTPAIIKSVGFAPMYRERGKAMDPTQDGFVNTTVMKDIGISILGDGQLTQTVSWLLNEDPLKRNRSNQALSGIREIIDAAQRAFAGKPVSISIQDRITYADTIGNEYVLRVVYEFNGSTFVLTKQNEQKTKAT